MKQSLLIVLSVFLLTATANTAQAWDKKDMAKLMKPNDCQNCNLSGANLLKVVLSKANLKRGCCQTNANSSQFSKIILISCSTKLLPLNKSSLTLNLISISRI
jgi:uncharacterized protein YjbI with pentapeptide repeats